MAYLATDDQTTAFHPLYDLLLGERLYAIVLLIVDVRVALGISLSNGFIAKGLSFNTLSQFGGGANAIIAMIDLLIIRTRTSGKVKRVPGD